MLRIGRTLLRTPVHVAGYLCLTSVLACANQIDSPVEPPSDVLLTVAFAENAATCDLGGYACGYLETVQETWSMRAWASTQKLVSAPGNATFISVNGYGRYQSGTMFAELFFLHCNELLSNACTDAEHFPVCDTEPARLSAGTVHAVGTGLEIISAVLNASTTCYPAYGGGGSYAGGTNCTTEVFTIEVWDGTAWVSAGTVPVTICV